jgi:phage DNA polymerase
MEECCELGENYAASSKELYQRYTAYCQVSGDYRRDSRDFANAMKSAGFELKHKMHGNAYTGLRLHSGFSPQ